MLTQTREKKENSEIQTIRIPKNISKDIQERGFHLYKWISPDEVKLSIERDFLRVLKFIGLPLAIVSILATFIGGLNPLLFFATIFIAMGFVFLYLLLLSIKRSRLLSKSAFVVMTDSSISLGGKVKKLSEVSHLKNEIDNVSKTFEEELFSESKLSSSKKGLMQEVMSQLFGGYGAIFRMLEGSSRTRINNSKDSAGGVMIILVLYTAYIAIMASVYFIGVLFLFFLGKLFIWLNTIYLIKRGQSVIKINRLFGDLDIHSQDLKDKRKTLKNLISSALENDWKNGLLLDINAGIESINSTAQSAVIEVLELRNTITRSKYRDMFRFEVYNGWIKKQISAPLQDIKTLLENTQNTLLENKVKIETQIQETKKADLQGVLKLQLTRVEMQIQETQKFMPKLKNSIDSLR